MKPLRDLVPVDGEPACRWVGVSPEWFFRTDPEAREAAARLCRQCPFRDPCLAYSLANLVAGYWAGTTEEDRTRLRRELGIVAAPLTWDRPREEARPKPYAQCGTYAGYAAHRRRHERACQPCKDGMAAYARGLRGRAS